MDESVLFGSLMRGLLGVRPKRSGRALRYIMGGRGFLSNPATLITAAGLAWGVFDTLKQTQSPGWTGASTAPTGTPSGPAVVPPPIPGSGSPAAASAPAAGPVSDDVVRLVRLAISAAYADGAVSDHERAAIVQQAQAAGAAEIVDRELQYPRPLKDIVAGVTDPAQRATLYVLAFTVIRADEQVSGSERIYLAQLANLLGLDPATVTALEKDTGERIDALGDQGQLGG
jgi:uncharacterized membrane protein YebE (DUF533 family)